MSQNLRQSIEQHEGKKYLKKIYPANGVDFPPWILVDVYSVLDAFEVTCPATAHAIKKLLCAGQRGKGTRKDDLIGVLAAVNRAIDLEGRGVKEEREPEKIGVLVSDKYKYRYNAIEPLHQQKFDIGDMILITTHRNYTENEAIETWWGKGTVIQATDECRMTGLVLQKDVAGTKEKED